jgi:hypothetical protein
MSRENRKKGEQCSKAIAELSHCTEQKETQADGSTHQRVSQS